MSGAGRRFRYARACGASDRMARRLASSPALYEVAKALRAALGPCGVPFRFGRGEKEEKR